MGSESSDFEQRVLGTVKSSQERRDPPLIWAMEVSKCIQEKGLGIPNPELGHVLVSNLCFTNNNPTLWKFVEQGICSRLLSPLHVLALLTSRVIPHRQSQPEAYRLYLELLSRYAFSFPSIGTDMCKEEIVKSVDDALQLSQKFGIRVSEVGHAVVLFLFRAIISLIDCTLEDWGLQSSSMDKQCSTYGNGGHQDMDIDAMGNSNDKRHEHRENLRRMNAFMALEVVERLIGNKKAMVLLRLVHLNMPAKFNGLLQRLQFLEANKSTSSNIKSASYLLVRLTANVQRALRWEYKLSKHQIVGVLIDIGSCSLSSSHNFGAGQAACWLAFDMYMENAMDGRHLPAKSAVDILAELTKSLQVVNQASWQETFLALWISALRLMQRERDPMEGPVPHLDARLCALLSITPLTIVRVVEEDGEMSSVRSSGGPGNVVTGYNHGMEGNEYSSRRRGLIAALQILGQFSGLLVPPASVVAAANSAAARAATFISSFKNGNDSFKGVNHGDTSVKAVGNMRHLIVEACIARKLIDTSAYFWPGYVAVSATSLTDSSLVQVSPWSTFMEGSQLTDALKNALIATPASSLMELQRLYHFAINGSEEEQAAAAKILCGASLTHGWNIEEHVVHFAVKFLSPPVPPEFSGPGSHLVAYMSMLNVILFGLSSSDIVHVLSLYGVVPEVAAALMPICEAFGSLMPTSNNKSSTNDEPSAYTVFSCAFLFLLRLWKFYRPSHDHCIMGPGGSNGSAITLEYLLLLRNSRIASHNSTPASNNATNPLDVSQLRPVYIDSFPKLRAWYSLNQACIASTLSGLCNGNPVLQVANKIVSIIYWKMTKSGTASGNSSTPSSGNISGSPASSGDEAYQRPVLPAWEILEAIPFVLEALLTACAHGRLSPRDLTTGLKDLVDFLPASLVAIVSYFSAELTRGIWKPVSMNGIDWPSPAANLLLIESEIQEILASAGVNPPSCHPGGISPVMLPLPMAAMVSLTITFKLDKSLEYIHGVAGTALENCGSACPWPSMPIIGALWAQKVRRWHDFIVSSCCRSVVKQDEEAIGQLLRSCFATFLGSPHVSSTPGGVTGLLGHNVGGHSPRVRLAPGFLYLRTCRDFHNVQFVNDVILELVAESARKSAVGWAPGQARLKSGRASLAGAAARAKEVAMLGASLVLAAGGPQLVQLLYQETMPTWLLSSREWKVGVVSGPGSCIMEGYAMAYLLVLSGTFAWGIGGNMTKALSRWGRVVGIHMDFMAGVLEGNISLGCNPATWKAYLSSFVGLVVSFAPAWILELKPETLRKLATGLRGWHESELALALLERGGEAAMSSVAEMFM